MNRDLHFSSKSNEWETPQWLFDKLNQTYKFDLDAAASKDNTKCSKFFTQEDDALAQEWNVGKNVWLNPPYGRLVSKFAKKAYEQHIKYGITIVMLVPARVDTGWWFNYCAKGEVFFLKGRLKFINKSLPSYSADGNFKMSAAPFPSAIVVFGENKEKTHYVNWKE